MLVLGLRGKGVVQARSHIRMMNPGLGSPSRGWVGRANYIGKEGSDLMAGEEKDLEGKQLHVEAGGVDPDLTQKQPVGDVLGQHEG